MSDRKPSEYVILILIANVVFMAVAWYFANYVFVQWQKIPQEYFGYDTLYLYYKHYGDIEKVATAIKVSTFSGFVLWLILNTAVAVALFTKPKQQLHGSARFANIVEIKKAGFLPTPKQEQQFKSKHPSRPPVIIGKYKEQFLQFYGNEFISIGAPTRSGKGVSIVIPNLLTYPDSVVVMDIKMENWGLTAGFRSQYQDVYLFAPSSPIHQSHRYNPLDYISRDELKRMSDIQNIANIFYPANSGNDTSDYFNAQAQRLFTGLVLYMLETPDRPCTLAELIRLAEQTPLNEWIITTIDKRKADNCALSAECIQALMSYAGNPADNTRGGIDSTLKTPLSIFTDPMVASATSASDFKLTEVREHKMTIYIGIQPNELARFAKLINMMFSQLIDLNTRTLPEQDPKLKYQCLVLLDEFTALGEVEIIKKSIAYIAGYNMRLMPIFQSKAQVEDAYGRDGAKSIFANIACQIEFTPTEQQQAEELSKMLGTHTVKGKSVSRNRGKGGGGSISTSDQSRALMLPQELKEMSDEQQLIFFRRTKPIKCQKAFYYTNPTVFASRMSKLSEPAQGLPIPPKNIPPKHNLMAILEVMRGIQSKPPETISDITDGKKMVGNKAHDDFFKAFNKELGFDGDFLAQDNKTKAQQE